MARAPAPLPETHGWVQLQLHLDPFGLGWACFVTSAFADALVGWRASGLVARFWYMHKDPGIRLRFQGEHAAIQAEVGTWLAALAARGQIAGWSTGVYTPERDRLGGEVGLERAHTWFDAESPAVLRWMGRRVRGEATRTAEAFSLDLLEDLLAAALPEPEQRGEVWRRVAAERAPDLPIMALTPMDPVRPPPDAVERDLLAPARAAGALVGASLAQAAADGLLSRAPEALLAEWILFHWNRMGFRALRQAEIAAGAAARARAPR